MRCSWPASAQSRPQPLERNAKGQHVMAAYYKPPASFSEYAAGQPPPSLQQPGLHYQEQQHHQHNYDHPAILQSGSAAASPHHYQQQGYHGPLPRPPPQQQPWQAPPSYAHLNEETLSRLPAEDGARDSRSQLDDGVTLAPYDSISNVGYDEGSESGGPQQPPRPSRFSQVRHSATVCSTIARHGHIVAHFG